LGGAEFQWENLFNIYILYIIVGIKPLPIPLCKNLGVNYATGFGCDDFFCSSPNLHIEAVRLDQ